MSNADIDESNSSKESSSTSNNNATIASTDSNDATSVVAVGRQLKIQKCV